MSKCKTQRHLTLYNSVAYQPRSKNELIDPLADPASCIRDAALMAKLGLNVIRVYQVSFQTPLFVEGLLSRTDFHNILFS